MWARFICRSRWKMITHRTFKEISGALRRFQGCQKAYTASFNLRILLRIALFRLHNPSKTHQLFDFKLIMIQVSSMESSMFSGTWAYTRQTGQFQNPPPPHRLEDNEPRPHISWPPCFAREIRAEIGFQTAAPGICYQDLILLKD